MKLSFGFRHTARRGGGLFVGARLHFPLRIVDVESRHPWGQWTRHELNLGLVFGTLDVYLDFGRATTEDGC